MKEPAKMSRTAILVEAALMVALAFVLSIIPFFEMPLGGSVTLFSTLPIVLISLRHNTKWGVATAMVYALLQAFQGMDSILYLKTAGAMLACALLDYLLAYVCVGFTGAIARRFTRPTLGLAVGILATGGMRFLCSFLSGWIVWTQYTPEGWPVALWSLVYNGGWCLPDVAIVLVAALLLSRVKALHLVPGQKSLA